MHDQTLLTELIDEKSSKAAVFSSQSAGQLVIFLCHLDSGYPRSHPMNESMLVLHNGAVAAP